MLFITMFTHMFNTKYIVIPFLPHSSSLGNLLTKNYFETSRQNWCVQVSSISSAIIGALQLHQQLGGPKQRTSSVMGKNTLSLMPSIHVVITNLYWHNQATIQTDDVTIRTHDTTILTNDATIQTHDATIMLR